MRLGSGNPDGAELGEDFLSLVPERNANLRWEATPAGEVSVTLKQRGSLPLFPSRAKKIVFDKTGSYVLGLIDGRRTGSEIARILSDTRGLSIDQAEASTREFLQTLQKRGIVTLREQAGAPGLCRLCGAELPAEALYCPQCGVKQNHSSP